MVKRITRPAKQRQKSLDGPLGCRAESQVTPGMELEEVRTPLNNTEGVLILSEGDCVTLPDYTLNILGAIQRS